MYKEKIDQLVGMEPQRAYHELIQTMKSVYTDYLQGKLDDQEVSDLTVTWWATNDKFSDRMLQINPKIKELSKGMDITHPDFSKDKKKRIIQDLLSKADDMTAYA